MNRPALLWRWLPPGDAAWEAWAGVERCCGPVGVPGSLAWTRAWSAAYGDVAAHRVGVASDGGQDVGATVVVAGRRRRAGITVRTAHLGTAGEPGGRGVEAPYGRLLAAPGERDRVAAALVAALRRDRRWDVVLLERLRAEDARALLDAAPSWAARAEPSATVDLRAERPAVPAASLPARTRAQLRRAVRAHGPVAVEVADGVADAHAVLDELIALHEARFAGDGAFSAPRFARFHRALVDALVPDDRLLLVRVRDARRTLGCVAVLRDGPRALSYTGGMAPPRGPRDKPGFLVHAAAGAVCAGRGMDEYDLLTGEAPYKRELGRLPREQWTLRGERRRPRVLAGTAGRRLRAAVPERRAPAGGPG